MKNSTTDRSHSCKAHSIDSLSAFLLTNHVITSLSAETMSSMYRLGTVTGTARCARKFLNRSSNACPMVVITSSARPPPHSITWHARPWMSSFATYATKSIESWNVRHTRNILLHTSKHPCERRHLLVFHWCSDHQVNRWRLQQRYFSQIIYAWPYEVSKLLPNAEVSERPNEFPQINSGKLQQVVFLF